MNNMKAIVASEMKRFRGGKGARERMYGHLRLAVRELRLVGVSPPDAESILMTAVQIATYENADGIKWPKEVPV